MQSVGKVWDEEKDDFVVDFKLSLLFFHLADQEKSTNLWLAGPNSLIIRTHPVCVDKARGLVSMARTLYVTF